MDMKNLNNTGKNICEQLINIGMPMSKVKSVARYYVDMQNAVEKCYGMLRDGGMVFFVVGDTEYKNVKIQNSRHLVEVLEKISSMILKLGREQYQNGFVYLIGMKLVSSQKTSQNAKYIMKNLLLVGGFRNEFRYCGNENR